MKSWQDKRERTMIIVDFGNIDKWQQNLGWKVGIPELGKLTKHLSTGKKFLRRFYYGSDYGKKERSQTLSMWSDATLQKARASGFEIVTKRVKYIHDSNNPDGFMKKCDLDVEMAIDLVREQDNYDTVIIFSGDGDLMYAVRYMHEKYKKECFVFGARGHIGAEVFDAKKDRVVEDILFADDFEYRLNLNRFI